MNKELFRQAKQARIFLLCTVFLGLLGAVATIAQMSFLSKVIDRVLISGEGLGQVSTPLLLLLGAVVLRSGLFGCAKSPPSEGQST